MNRGLGDGMVLMGFSWDYRREAELRAILFESRKPLPKNRDPLDLPEPQLTNTNYSSYDPLWDELSIN